MFRGHEADARPGAANPDRWMYEFLETTVRDEWYHLKPEGQERIARYAATFGDFGAQWRRPGGERCGARGGPRAGDARSAAEPLLADPSLWAGRGCRWWSSGWPTTASTWNGAWSLPGRWHPPRRSRRGVRRRDAPWAPRSDVRLESRWNAAAQSVFVGDAALSLTEDAPVWSGSARVMRRVGGRLASRRLRTVRSDTAHRSAYRGPLRQAWATQRPHAWAGGPYVATAGPRSSSTREDRIGSRGLDAMHGISTATACLRTAGFGTADAASTPATSRRHGWQRTRHGCRRSGVGGVGVGGAVHHLASSPSTPCISCGRRRAATASRDAAAAGRRSSAPRGPDSGAASAGRAPAARMSGQLGRRAL